MILRLLTLPRLRRARAAAQARYDAAVHRGDTRAMHHAQEDLKLATHALMRAGG